MERFNGNIGAFQSALYETPEVLQSVRVYLPIHVLFGMVNDSMSVFLVQSPIRMTIIRRKLRAGFDVISNKCMQSVTLSVLKNLSSHLATTLQDSADDNFVRSAFGHSRLSHFGAFVFVHESGLTADEGFVNFDVPLHFCQRAILESQADT